MLMHTKDYSSSTHEKARRRCVNATRNDKLSLESHYHSRNFFRFAVRSLLFVPDGSEKAGENDADNADNPEN